MKILARISFPSSQRIDDRLESLPKRRRAIVVRDSDSNKEDVFTFTDVYAMAVTYHRACSVDMIQAYDQLAEMDDSCWLIEIKERLSKQPRGPANLKHFRIYLDDGPCYEFIAASFEHSSKPA